MALFRSDDPRSAARRALALLGQAAALATLPPRVAWFFLRAMRLARSLGDDWSLLVATRPRELAALLRVARGRRSVVEIGTASGWTAMALALADPERTVVTVDPVAREHRDAYAALAPSAAARITFVTGLGEDGPAASQPPVDLLFVDGAHDADATAGAFAAWRPALAPGAITAFHDFGDPAYPGVEEAVRRLGLRGSAANRLFVWRA